MKQKTKSASFVSILTVRPSEECSGKRWRFCTFLDYLVPSLRFPFHPLLVLRTSYDFFFLTIRLAVHSPMEYGSQTEHGSQNVRYYPGICSRKETASAIRSLLSTLFLFYNALSFSLSTPSPSFSPPPPLSFPPSYFRLLLLRCLLFSNSLFPQAGVLFSVLRFRFIRFAASFM